jgi:hypothetical protein
MTPMRNVFLGIAVTMGNGCAPACPPPAPPAPSAAPEKAAAPENRDDDIASFDLSKQQLRRGGASEELIDKLAKSRFRYFRMLAEAFELRICDAFRDRSGTLPVSAVHGDPHLEQFVVTGKTYGLEDFDRSGFGPMVIDLVRYGASLHVACSEVTWPCDAGAVVERFFRAFRDALDRKPPQSVQPAVVERLRAKAPRATRPWLAWSETLMTPLPPAVEPEAKRSWSRFAELTHEIHPDWPETMLDAVRIGSVSVGFGSALERKVLLRVAGPTSAPDDDLVIEAREGTRPDTRGCVWRSSYGESLILMFMSILGRRMPTVYGFVPLPGSSRRFWVQSWDPGYAELSVSDVTSQPELEELAIDAARQLGGHVWTKFPEVLQPQQRHAQLEAFDSTRDRAVALSRQLALEAIAAWERFAKPAAR